MSLKALYYRSVELSLFSGLSNTLYIPQTIVFQLSKLFSTLKDFVLQITVRWLFYFEIKNTFQQDLFCSVAKLLRVCTRHRPKILKAQCQLYEKL
mgnify:CR=1 FL=1